MRVYRDGVLPVEVEKSRHARAGRHGSGRADPVHRQRRRHRRRAEHLWHRRHLRVRRQHPPGQCRVSTLLPNADTADADWTPLGAGNHFAEVDDDNGDTSYIASDTPGGPDMFDVEDLPFTPKMVHAVRISWRARKDDAATREVRSRIRSDAATADGATRTLTLSYLYYHDVFEQDPDAVGPWTGAAVAAMEIRRRHGDLTWPRAASARSLPKS